MILKKIKKSYNSKIILNNINFVLNNNDKVALVGNNGSGKSTLLKVISGELAPDAGNINYNNETVDYLRQEIDHKYDEYTILDYIKTETGVDV